MGAPRRSTSRSCTCPPISFVAAGMLPDRRDGSGPFAWWTQMRPRFFAGFHRCLPALADTGNDLIVEHVIEFPAWRDELSRLLAHLDVFLIGVHCDLDELDRRERSRGDRQICEGRSHVDENLIHSFGPYDLDSRGLDHAYRIRSAGLAQPNPITGTVPGTASGTKRRSPRHESARCHVAGGVGFPQVEAIESQFGALIGLLVIGGSVSAGDLELGDHLETRLGAWRSTVPISTSARPSNMPGTR
jgi:Chloramphenicol phosphotransferase-like protein